MNIEPGQRYGLLVVLREAPRREPRNVRWWTCRCDCGVEKDVRQYLLKSGDSKSCGCRRVIAATQAKLKHGCARANRQTPEYQIWKGIINRLTLTYIPAFPSYGGRGISMCERWWDFSNFIADMGPRPSKKHSIDRIDVNGNYEPSNCRWVTWDVQAHNRTDNVFIEHDGRRQTLTQWANEIGVKVGTLWWRHRRGWPPEAILTPVSHPYALKPERHGGAPHQIGGEVRTISEWAAHFGTSLGLIRCRVNQGWDLDKAIRTPPNRPDRYECNGLSLTLAEWSARTGISKITIWQRLRDGWPLEKALFQPSRGGGRPKRKSS